MNTTIFIDPVPLTGRKVSEKISILATELTVVEKYLTMGFATANDLNLIDRKAEIERDIKRLEEIQKHQMKPTWQKPSRKSFMKAKRLLKEDLHTLVAVAVSLVTNPMGPIDPVDFLLNDQV
jgi:hypothetical protein